MSQANRLYKIKRRAKLLGVCAGVGDYFNINVGFIRLLTVVGCFVFPIAVPLSYIVAAIFLEDKPYQEATQDEFYNSLRNAPQQTLQGLRHRFNTMELRLRKMEKHVTSREREFEQDIG